MKPDLSVVVPTHDRPLRLRWLLNALAAQTLPRERFEICIAHDSLGPETDELLRDHPLTREGTLRYTRIEAGTGGPPVHRNLAWRMARADVVVFTDDDCRPPEDWLENALRAAREHPGAVIQGMTLKDPTEIINTHAPNWRSQQVIPPTRWAETCNMIYPREVLERLGGFREGSFTGDDTDLAIRAQQAGVPYVPARDVVTYHAVDEQSLWQAVRGSMRWSDFPLLLKRHPQVREDLPLWIFWKRRHLWLLVFFAGVRLSKRSFLFTALCVPWLAHAQPTHGTNVRGRYRGVSELPLRMAIDVAEIVAMLRGSVQYRTLII